MDTFKITLTLVSPLVTQEGGCTTLDGLLAALQFEATGDPQAYNNLPLQRTEVVWHASAAHLETWHTGRMGFVANLRAAHDMDVELIARKKDDQPHTKLGLTRRRDFGAVMNSDNSHAASSISGYIQSGQPARCASPPTCVRRQTPDEPGRCVGAVRRLPPFGAFGKPAFALAEFACTGVVSRPADVGQNLVWAAKIEPLALKIIPDFSA